MVNTNLIFIGMIFESVIIVIATILLIIILKRYLEKRQKPTFNLLMIFINILLSVIFTWLSKVLRLYSGLDFIVDDTIADPNTILSWFLLRIIAFRFSFLFILIAIYLSYILRVDLFSDKVNKLEKAIMTIYFLTGAVMIIILYEKGNLIYDLVAFIIVAVYMIIIYIPLMNLCIKAFKSIEDPVFKRAFLSLAIMSLSFSLILVCQLIDRIYIIGGSDGYTIFYFMGWIFVLIGMSGAYYGYIKPKSIE